MKFILVTIGIVLASNLVGAIYSYLVLYTGWFKNLRLQKRAYKPNIFFERLPLILLNLLLLIVITCGGLYFMADRFILEFPAVWLLVIQTFVIFLIDDAWFYVIHRWMHENTYMMRKIHSIHHRAMTPFPLEYIYVHPLEWFIGSFGSFIGLGVLLLFGGGEVNAWPFWTYIVLRNLHEIEIHSDLRSIIADKIPLLAPTEHHDLHHARVKGNYASTFRIWDRVFKTELNAKYKT